MTIHIDDPNGKRTANEFYERKEKRDRRRVCPDCGDNLWPSSYLTMPGSNLKMDICKRCFRRWLEARFGPAIPMPQSTQRRSA